MSKNCVFCKIRDKEIPSSVVYEDNDIMAFKDQSPQAPVHILIIPKTHIESINYMNEKDKNLLGYIMLKTKELAKKLDIAESGYRLVINTNHMGGQAVYHLHVHLLGGRQLSWPPG